MQTSNPFAMISPGAREGQTSCANHRTATLESGVTDSLREIHPMQTLINDELSLWSQLAGT